MTGRASGSANLKFLSADSVKRDKCPQKNISKLEEQDPTFQDVSDPLLKLSLSKKRGNTRLSKQIYVN